MKKLCTDCFYIGKEETKAPYILIFDVIILGFLVFCVIKQLWIGAIFWGIIFAIYFSLVRLFRKRTCPECGHQSMIPTDSVKAKELIREHKLIT